MTNVACSTQSFGVIPPPPPSNSINLYRNTTSRRQITRSPFFNECAWAGDQSEVRQACSIAQICTTTEPKFFRIKTSVRPIIQEGPTCGLAALAMLTGGCPSVADILELARQRNYSNHGEMFSAKNMGELATTVFEMLDVSHRTERVSGKLECDFIKNKLRDGACVMVAYDSDFNHSPCLKNGHKAHWALIIGCLIDRKNQFYVFVRHGKTRNVALWSLRSLSDSNSNLNEYTAPHRYDEYSFQMPIDGIAGKNGLKEQCIILEDIAKDDEIVCDFK